MHGVPQDLNIPGLIGDRLDHITTYQYQVAFVFDRNSVITVESKVEIFHHEQLEARWNQADRWSPAGFSSCLGAIVESFVVPDRHELQIRLHDGWLVRIYDQAHYEAFHIEPLGIHI